MRAVAWVRYAHIWRAAEKIVCAPSLSSLQVRYVDETELLKADPALRSFFDLDTPQDVAIAMRHVRDRDSAQ